MIVVSDTSPICYLLLIGEIEILPQLYGQVLIPTTVYQELLDPKSPSVIREWLRQAPQWLGIQTADRSCAVNLDALDPGEQDAILLARQTAPAWFSETPTPAIHSAEWRIQPRIELMLTSS